MVKAYVQKKLDDFAKIKGYDDCKTLTNYDTSMVNSWVEDVNKAVYLRDTCWVSLYSYLAEVESGAKRPPRTSAYIDVLLPALTW